MKWFFMFLITIVFNIEASEVIFFGENAVVPDLVQKEMIANSIIALVEDCSIATQIKQTEIIHTGQGLEVIFSSPIEFSSSPAGRVTNVSRIVIRLWNNAEKNYGMYIYAYADSQVYLLAKYHRLAYPIINMIKRPMPPNQ